MSCTGFRFKKDNCPYCKKSFDSAIEINNEDVKPTEGDYTICIGCLNYLQFGKNLKLQKLDGSAIPSELLKDMNKAKDLLLKFKCERNN